VEDRVTSNFSLTFLYQFTTLDKEDDFQINIKDSRVHVTTNPITSLLCERSSGHDAAIVDLTVMA
jgi:hypothetical protein